MAALLNEIAGEKVPVHHAGVVSLPPSAGTSKMFGHAALVVGPRLRNRIRKRLERDSRKQLAEPPPVLNNGLLECPRRRIPRVAMVERVTSQFVPVGHRAQQVFS